MRLPDWLRFNRDTPAVTMNGDKPSARFSGDDVISFSSFPWMQSDYGPGVRVSREQALAIPAVLKGRNLIAGVVSTLPLCATDSVNDRVRVPLLEQIDPNVPNSVTMAQTIEDLLFEGISWWKVTARDADNYPMYAEHIDHRNITWQIPNEFPLNRLPSGYYPGSHAFILSQPVPAADVKRFDSTNPALLVYAARTIRRALKLELAADRYADNPSAKEYFTPADGADPDETDVDDMLDGWEANRRLRTTGFVPSGFIRNDINQLSPAEIQLATMIEKVTKDLANAMGLDAEDVGVSTTSRTYKNDVTSRQNRVNDCYGPYLTAIQERLSMPDITRRKVKVRFDLDDYLKADPLTRMQVQTGYLAAKTTTPEEIRAEEGKPPFTVQQQLELADQAANQQPQLPPGHPDSVSGSNYNGAPAATFSGDAQTQVMFAASDVAQSFSVNQTKRTITGLVMPWDKVGRADGRLWKFAPNSLKFDPALISRNKLLFQHDNSASVGHMVKTWSDGVGQWATYKVAKGPAGDKALTEARDHVRDGLSAGVGFAGSNHGMEFGADPTGPTGGVIYVTSAPWRETSLVAIPAFDDARTSAVAFSADNTGGTAMHCEHCGQDHAPGVTCPTANPAPVAAITYSADQVAAMFSAMGQRSAPAPAVVDEVPAVVNSAPRTNAVVVEQPLYRFDGGTAQRCFTGDISRMVHGDAEAGSILTKFMNEQMAAMFANITPGNVADLNPVPTRPELYVPNLHFSRPLGSLITTGPLSNLIAFIVPKYSTSSGLVADHTTGTEPSDGAFQTTSQTITPKGISGRVDVDREVIDSGGSPQADQIIYAEMGAAYAQQLETRVQVMLDATSIAPTGTAIIGTNKTLQANLTTFLAGLQFIRGGDIFNGLALADGLYGALAGAVDDQGRPLFPMINPVNSNGGTAPDLSTIQVGSKVGVPAWALTTGNGGHGYNYLIDPSKAYQWASAPRRIDLTNTAVASVAIGIWGYSAEAVTQAAAVRRLVYSAT